MSSSTKNQALDSQPAVQLQETSSHDGYKQQLTNVKKNSPVAQNEESPKRDIFGFWQTVIFFGIIFALICGFVIYQQINKQPHLTKDNNDKDEYIVDEPYKQGDEVAETYDFVLLNTTGALCLDGSPGSYYESKTGDPSRIILYFQGGGWCYGLDEQETLQECYKRSKMWSGTSAQYHPPTVTHQNNVFSRHPDNEFRNWKKIILNYCDGASHQGSRKDPVIVNGQRIYFRGYNITTQRFEDLERKLGMFSKAKTVVVSGGSAGGLAVFFWVNYLAERVKNGKVYALIDSGIFYDGVEINLKKHYYKQNLANLMKFSNTQLDPPTPQCLKDHPNQKVNCMFGQYLYKHIKVPMYVIQSTYDSITLSHMLGIRCNNPNNCPEESNKVIEQNRQNVSGILKDIAGTPGNGIFGIGCILHGMIHDDSYVNSKMSVPSGSGMTVSRAVGHWFRNRKANNSRIDFKPWPTNQGCANLNIF